MNLNREEFYPVQIVEIASVLPRVANPTTFNPHKSSPMIFKSRIAMKMEEVCIGEIGERVFIDRFSKQTLHDLDKLYYDSDDDTNNNTSEHEDHDHKQGTINDTAVDNSGRSGEFEGPR